MPFTTGILVGVGETRRDRAESLLVIKQLHEQYGHLQDVIIQNVVPNDRSQFDQPSVETMHRVTPMARSVLPADVEVQVPPSLLPVDELLDCGVGDLGGVSPITDDHINPDYEWPELRYLEEFAANTDKELVERLPVYERYLDAETPTVDESGRNQWVSDSGQRAITAADRC